MHGLRTLPKEIKVLLTFISFFILIYGIYSLVSPPSSLTVTRNDGGFTPEKITLAQHGTVTFKNMGQVDIWPASDSHPTHGRYKGLDPKEPIPPGGMWQFTFTRAGTWTLHDHLEPNKKITVVVKGENKTETECTLKKDGSPTAECLSAPILSSLDINGLDEAFKVFTNIHKENQEFQGNCHDVMHILGASAYMLFISEKETIARPETRYCGYGFYHGFIEEMLLHEGVGNIASARSYCESLREDSGFPSLAAGQQAEAACYHGLGHAFFDNVPGTLWGDEFKMVSFAREECSKLFEEDEKKVQCASGVFNSLSNAYSRKDYFLSFRDAHPFGVCEEQEKIFQEACYKEISVGYTVHARLPLEETLALIKSVPDEHLVESMIFVFFDDALRYPKYGLTPETIAPLCKDFEKDSWQKACVRSVLVSFQYSALPEQEYVPMFPFCSLFENTPLRAPCISYIGALARSIHSEEKSRQICELFTKKEERDACLIDIP